MSYWPNAWFTAAIVAIALAPATAAIIADAAGLRRSGSEPPPEPGGRLRGAWRVTWLALSWALLSWTSAAILAVVGVEAFSGPEGEPVHTGWVTEVESCNRHPGALWLSYRCDLWAEAPTSQAHDIERFHALVVTERPLEPGDRIGLWPGEPTRNGRAPWDLHPLDTDRPHLRQGQLTATIAAPALAAAAMLAWAVRRPVRLGAGTAVFDHWTRGGDGDAGGGDGGD